MLNETPNKKIEKTKSAPKLIFVIGILLVGLGLIVFGVRGALEDKVYIRTPKMLIKAEVADNETERIQGLSSRDKLSTNQAMLFIFDKPDIYGIWMKDMKFAIDIIWLDSNKKVVKISENIQPSSYPEVFKPDNKSLYVIEFAGGRASELGINIGQTLSW